MRAKFLLIAVLIGFSLPGCSRGPSEGILGSTRFEGRGYPFGESNRSLAAHLTSISTDPTYGYSPENPVKVGGVERAQGRNVPQQQYLSALLGPKGEPITFEREGHCCPYESPNGLMGWAVLDVYVIRYRGLRQPVRLYLSLYDFEEPIAPAGFTIIR